MVKALSDTVTADECEGLKCGQERMAATFEELVELHQARVARLAQRLLGWPADVEDVVQEVFVAAWKSFGMFRGESSAATWLVRITVNQCRRENRKAVMQRLFLRRVARMWHESEELKDGVEADERLRRVRDEVRKLPGRYREVVVLRYLEGLDVAEVTKVLKLSRSAVDVRLHRARGLLKESLGNEVIW